MAKKIYSKTNMDFINKIMGVLESFKHKGRPYLAYLQSRERNDEFLMRDNLVKPLFQALGYDQQQDFSPEETIVSGRIDTTIRNGYNHSIIVIETQSSLLEDLTKHRNRLFIFTEEVGARFAVLTDGVRFEAWECPGRGKARFLRVSLNFQELYSRFLKKGVEGLSELDVEKVLKLKFLSKELLFVREEELYEEPELHVSAPTVFSQLIDDLQDAMELVKSDIISQFEVQQRGWQEYQELINTRKLYPGEFKKYEPAKRTIDSYSNWQKVSPGANSGSQELFCTETMYILFNRLLLIRICEDKGLTPRQISNGGIKIWLSWKGFMEFKKANYAELLRSAYETMNRVYPHLFHPGIFDWYLPDSDIVLRILFILNRYNFKNVDRDVLGKLYEKYIDKEERKRLGQFYTPEEVIDYILEAVGYTPEKDIEGKKLLDPACGSGGFLVRAVKALVERYQRRNIPAEIILNRVRDSIYGFDINPFAAHLAEMNLLFQVIDLINEAKKANPDFNMEKFNIFVTDSLRMPKVEEQGQLPLGEEPSEYLEEAEIVKQIKLKQGDFSQGFDFVVGNPPYLKANAPQQEVLRLRRQIEKQNYFQTLFEKWDLYIPFIEFGFKATKEGGWFSFIVSDAYRTADYALKSRKMLLEGSKIAQLDFFPGLRLFDEPQVENCIFAIQKKTPLESDEVKRIKHLDQKDLHNYEVLKPLRQLQAEGKIFYPEEREALLAPTKLLPLEDICYISKGMVLNSDEKRYKGEFRKDDLISNVKTDIHCKPYIEGKDVSRYTVKRIRFLEWGTDRVPAKVSRPTFPELHESEKIVVGETSGVAYDDRNLYCDQSARIFIPYYRLIGIQNNTLKRKIVQRKIGECSEISKRFGLRYIVALLNSTPLWDYFLLNISRRGERIICPDDWRNFPIAYVSPETQSELVTLADQMLEISKKLPELEKLASNLPELLTIHNMQTKDLADCPDATLVMKREVIGKPTIKREQRKVYFDRTSYVECTDENLPKYLELYLSSAKDELRGKTKTELYRLLQVPKPAKDIEAILTKQENLLKQVEDLKQRRDDIEHEIDQKVCQLYGIDWVDNKEIKRVS
jgi:hypothetical protein